MKRPLICVIGVRGNLGASTLTLHLAGALGGCAVDTRLFGGLDALAGIEDHEGPRWPHLTLASHAIEPESLLKSAPKWWQVPVLSGGRFTTANTGGEHLSEFAGASAYPDMSAQSVRVSAIIESLRSVTPIVADIALDKLDSQDERSLLDEATLILLVVGRDVMSARVAKNVAAHCTSKTLLVARCYPGMSLSAHDVAAAAGVPLGPVVAHTAKLVQPVECGVGPSRSRPRWDQPGRLTSPSPVSVEVAAARLSVIVREHS